MTKGLRREWPHLRGDYFGFVGGNECGTGETASDEGLRRRLVCLEVLTGRDCAVVACELAVSDDGHVLEKWSAVARAALLVGVGMDYAGEVLNEPVMNAVGIMTARPMRSSQSTVAILEVKFVLCS